MVESFPYERRAQAFARNSGVSIEAARALYADSLAFDLAQQADTVERYSGAWSNGRPAEPVDPPQPGEQTQPAAATEEPTEEQIQQFVQLMTHYFSSPANCEQFAKYMAGGDAGKDQPMNKQQMEAALAHQQQAGGSFEQAAAATKSPDGTQRYSSEQMRERLRAEAPPLTKPEMEAALKYMAQYPGVGFIAASDVVRGISTGPERYAATDRPRSEDVHRSGSGFAGFERVGKEIREARQQMFADRREREAKIDRINEMARSQGLPVGMVYEAQGMIEAGTATSLDSAVETIKRRLRNQAEFGTGYVPGVSITSLRPHAT